MIIRTKNRGLGTGRTAGVRDSDVPSMITFRRDQRGMALMVVMIAIFVLSVLAGAFAYAMKVETKLAMNSARESSDVYECGVSGVAVARAILVAYNNPNTPINLKQKWAGEAGEDFETNGPLAEVSLDKAGNLSMGGMNFPFLLKITDLSAKINVNAIANANPGDERLLQQALTMAGVDGGEIPAIGSAIIDWVDADENVSVNGAESSFYQTLSPPYYAKNAPFDDISELLFVRGITWEMFAGTEIADPNRASALFRKRDRFGRIIEGPERIPGLREMFTTISSSRKVNLNTTTSEVLQVLGFDEAMAQEIIRQRDQAPFRDLNEIKGQVPPELRSIIDAFCDWRSAVFEVRVTPKAGGFKRSFHATIGPGTNPKDLQVYNFYWSWNEGGRVEEME